MARTVILYFDDNKAAEDFIKEVQVGETVKNAAEWEPLPYRAIGMYAVPTNYCQCLFDGMDKFFTKGISKRGAKLGWYVHPKCGRPREGSVQVGRNLLRAGEPLRSFDVHFGYYASTKCFEPPDKTLRELQCNDSSPPQ